MQKFQNYCLKIKNEQIIKNYECSFLSSTRTKILKKVDTQQNIQQLRYVTTNSNSDTKQWTTLLIQQRTTLLTQQRTKPLIQQWTTLLIQQRTKSLIHNQEQQL